MIYMCCPTCGALLRHKQIVYEDRMEEECDKNNIDYEMVSSGLLDRDKNFIEIRSKIVNELCEKMCCKIYLMTFVKVGKIVK